VRQALSQALAAEDYRVVSASNQDEALGELIRQPTDQPIDIVLLDLHPRNENARETVQRLTDLQPSLPVVGMTGCLEEPHSIPMASMLDALMEKPLNIIQLLRTLSELISRHETPRRRRSFLAGIHAHNLFPMIHTLTGLVRGSTHRPASWRSRL
jgi:DNA-binding response OmpR family regulator